MNRELAEMMFDVLGKRVGTEVTCIEWVYGAPMEVKGILEEVVPFEKVVIDKSVRPFVAENRAIERITMEEKMPGGEVRPKTIFSNPKAVGFNKKGGEVIFAQEEMFGYSVIRSGNYVREDGTPAKSFK